MAFSNTTGCFYREHGAGFIPVPLWVPNCDDFTYGLETHRVWNATHSFVEVLKTALAVTKETWQLWQGTWFSIFLMTLMPGVFGENGIS